MQTPWVKSRTKSDPHRPSAVIVLGGHRCGTSSIAGAIAHLGIPAALPGDEIGPSASNLRGHFEDATLCRLHERMLGHGGWRDPRPVPQMGSRFDAYDTHLGLRAAAAAQFCIKDPRLCLLLPFLVERLQSLQMAVRVVTVTRASSAAAESLRRRQRMRPGTAVQIAWLYEGARRAQLVWLTQAGLPLLTVDYELALQERAGTVDRLATFVGVPPTNAASEFLEPDLRHQ